MGVLNAHSVMGPLLASCLWVFVIWGFVQLFFRPGPVGATIYAALGACLFSAYIVYDTHLILARAWAPPGPGGGSLSPQCAGCITGATMAAIEQFGCMSIVINSEMLHLLL